MVSARGSGGRGRAREARRRLDRGSLPCDALIGAAAPPRGARSPSRGPRGGRGSSRVPSVGPSAVGPSAVEHHAREGAPATGSGGRGPRGGRAAARRRRDADTDAHPRLQLCKTDRYALAPAWTALWAVPLAGMAGSETKLGFQRPWPCVSLTSGQNLSAKRPMRRQSWGAVRRSRRRQVAARRCKCGLCGGTVRVSMRSSRIAGVAREY